MSMVGRVFANRYEVVREIARGGMAHVYLARDRALSRNVALKVLFPEYAREPSFVERFRREAQAAANLNQHPNIVAIYDFGQEGGTYFIVMEFVDGETLRDELQRDGVIAPQRAAAIVAEVASALAFAHRSGVIHRDVKPGNVLLTADGVPKVADFGIARAGTSDALTQTGSVMGTATYFSPEQAQGLDVDGRSDVYSLGIVLYELVTGAPPFSGDSPISVALAHVRERAPLPSTRRPTVPPALEHIIMKAIAKSPAHRYADAEELRADLLRFRRGREPLAAPVTAIVADERAERAYADAANPTIAQPRTPPTGPPPGLPPNVAGPPNRGGRALAGVIIFSALALAILAILFIPRLLGNDDPRTVTVPNVETLREDEAIRTLELAGLESRVRRVQQDDQPDGIVIAQRPRANQRVDANSTVTITVNQAPPDIAIPAVTGLTELQAKDNLVEAGFHLENITVEAVFDNEQPANTVLSTRPAEGTLLPASGAITLVVSKGRELVTVPDVEGLEPAEADRAMEDEGLSVRFTDVASETVPEGTVTGSDPPGGAQVAKGTTVTVFVSAGPAQGELPDVVGLDEDAALAALQAAGFDNVRTLRTFTVNEDDVGKVVEQDPAGGQVIDQSTLILLQIGELATIPTLPTTTTSTTTTTTTTTVPSSTTTT
jgi:eukaryotic-like serine/threonine-protein kinase